jgi:hypothetical protein
MNGIKCNNEKTQIIFTGYNNHPSRLKNFNLKTTIIHTLPYKNSLKYLDCYFSGSDSSYTTSKQLTNKIKSTEKAILSTNWNGPISNQISQWIIPSLINYSLYVSHLSKTSINQFQKSINTIAKSKYHLEKTTPNFMINSP